MNATLSPRPGAAPLWQMVRAQALMETRLLLRNGEQLLLALVIPVLVLLGGVYGARRVGVDLTIEELTPGVLALAVMSTAFTSLAIATGFERRYGVIKRLGVSPLPRSGLLLGKIAGVALVLAVQVLVIGAVALALGWSPRWSGLPWLLVAGLLGTLAFGSLGMALAGVLRAEATLAAANLVYLLLLAGGGVVLPTTSYGALEPIVRLLPSGALGDACRAALIDGAWHPTATLVLALWGAAGAALTARTFRWE